MRFKKSKLLFQYIRQSTSTMQIEINQIEELYNKIPQQIIVNLNTQLEEFKLNHKHLQLSSNFDEDELNHMVQEMLGVQVLPRMEFIVDGYILRGKMKSHILRYQLSPEQALNIQYIVAFPQLQNEKNKKTDDWISSISPIQGPDGVLGFIASLYNGSIAAYSADLSPLGNFATEVDPLKDCTILPSELENKYYCLSGGMGELLQVNLISLGPKGIEGSELISSNIHDGTINCIEASPGSDMHIATGGAQGKIHIWQIPSDFSENSAHNSQKSKKKKVELNLNILPKLTSEEVHNGTVESLNWINNQEIVSSSSAHEIAITDIVKMSRSETILTRDSVPISIDTKGNQILSSHEDGQIRMWDRRQPSRPVQTYKAHSKWTSCIRFKSQSSIFASGSYDHTVKVWDSRCGFPIQNMHSKEEKVLAIEWLDNDRIVSGGSDSSLHLYNSK